jgi:hypothetical protein
MIIGCYFDEGGILPKDKIMVLAGFMVSPTDAVRISKKWDAVLKKFGVRVQFHAKEFYAPPEKIKESATNPYSGWSTKKRNKFISALNELMEDRALRVKGVAVDARAFRSKTLAERRYLTGGKWLVMKSDKWLLSGKPGTPYHYVLRAIIESCAGSVDGEDKVHLVMSTQEQNRGFTIQLYQTYLDRNPPFSFRPHMDDSISHASPASTPLLQAADLAAWRMREIAEMAVDNPDYEGDENDYHFINLAWERRDLQFATARTFDQHCEQFAKRLAETEKMAHQRRNALRMRVSHDPELCQIIGRVDAGGNFRRKVPNT